MWGNLDVVQMKGRGDSGYRRRRAWTAWAGFLAVATTLGLQFHQSAAAYADQTRASAGIRGEQLRLVAADHQAPLSVARLGVAELTAAVTRDSAALAADRTAQVAAAGRTGAAAVRVTTDADGLAAATAALAGADERLAGDRTQLRAIAVGMYTGALTDPQPTSLRQLEAEQTQIIDAAEVAVVAAVLDGHVHADLASASRDARQKDDARRQLASDRDALASAQAAGAAAAARTAEDATSLTADRAGLDAANRRLDAEEASLATALASVAGPGSSPPGQLSLLGGAALTASQLAGWFQAQGYVDLTSAPIDQLAAWYIQAGNQEGVRGDVAFAQAMLETGGFSSPDAIGLSNFAGIGHCDTCAAGWAFPSPQTGVLGQVQLLRIFADAGPGPAHAPPPVLPVLLPAAQMSAGRCPTVESLTGVWATDPTYGQQILDIYGQILSFALTNAQKS